MHSALNRAQGVFGFFTTLAAVLGLLTAVSVVVYPGEPVSSVELANVQVYVVILCLNITRVGKTVARRGSDSSGLHPQRQTDRRPS